MLDPVLDKQIIKKGLVLEDGLWVQSFQSVASGACLPKSYPIFTCYLLVNPQRRLVLKAISFGISNVKVIPIRPM